MKPFPEEVAEVKAELCRQIAEDPELDNADPALRSRTLLELAAISVGVAFDIDEGAKKFEAYMRLITSLQDGAQEDDPVTVAQFIVEMMREFPDIRKIFPQVRRKVVEIFAAAALTEDLLLALPVGERRLIEETNPDQFLFMTVFSRMSGDDQAMGEKMARAIKAIGDVDAVLVQAILGSQQQRKR